MLEISEAKINTKLPLNVTISVYCNFDILALIFKTIPEQPKELTKVRTKFCISLLRFFWGIRAVSLQKWSSYWVII